MPDLEVRRLGRTEMNPKSLGLGCGYLGNPKRADQEAITTIRHAIEKGINFVDTSPEYGEREYVNIETGSLETLIKLGES